MQPRLPDQIWVSFCNCRISEALFHSKRQRACCGPDGHAISYICNFSSHKLSLLFTLLAAGSMSDTCFHPYLVHALLQVSHRRTRHRKHGHLLLCCEFRSFRCSHLSMAQPGTSSASHLDFCAHDIFQAEISSPCGKTLILRWHPAKPVLGCAFAMCSLTGRRTSAASACETVGMSRDGAHKHWPDRQHKVTDHVSLLVGGLCALCRERRQQRG